MRPLLVVVGSANTDLVIRPPRLPQAGETVAGRRFEIVAGGNGANQAVAAARAGARVVFIANIGRDDFGATSIAGLRRERIDARYVVRSKSAPSGVALILVDGHGENLIGVARGSNDELRPADRRSGRPAVWWCNWKSRWRRFAARLNWRLGMMFPFC